MIFPKHLRRLGRCLLASLTVTITSAALAETVSIVDGDTLVIGNDVYRLSGIDAPEIAQDCQLGGRKWKCGIIASEELRRLVSDGVSCTQDDKDQYGRWLGVCTLPNGTDVNEAMVLNGWAVAFRTYSDTYNQQEAYARDQKLGIWAAEFERPVDFREAIWADYGSAAPDPNCPIKGNINRDKVKIYHTPWGSRHYKRTKVNTSKGERWFCTEREARMAGWRAPYR